MRWPDEEIVTGKQTLHLSLLSELSATANPVAGLFTSGEVFHMKTEVEGLRGGLYSCQECPILAARK